VLLVQLAASLAVDHATVHGDGLLKDGVEHGGAAGAAQGIDAPLGDGEVD
jgi:hypothetical protein